MAKYPDFFNNPTVPLQKKYEALRSYHVGNLKTKELAKKFDISILTFNTWNRDFGKALRSQEPLKFFIQLKPGPKKKKKVELIKDRVIALRKKYIAITDIKSILNAQNIQISLDTIHQIIKNEGFARLPKRTKAEKKNISIPELIQAPEAQKISPLLLTGNFTTRDGGALVFLPILKELKIEKLVKAANYPETKQIPSLNYILSFICLKILDKERLSHADDLNLDRGLGLFAGLNVLPKNTSMNSYSYNVSREMNRTFLKELFKATEKLFPFSGDVNLDFTAIPHWGDKSILENNWSGKRHQALKSILAMIAQDPDKGFISYTNAEIKHKNQSDEILKFVDFWQESTGNSLKCLIFDSKLTTYENLDKLNQDKVKFITIRCRSKNLVNSLEKIKKNKWQTVAVTGVKRKHQKLRVYENKRIRLNKYKGYIRQIVITNHGHKEPTFIITNDFDSKLNDIVKKYARRWLVEKSIAEQIDFFHLNRVSSSIVVKVDFDLTMTVIANTLYRLLAFKLIGFENCTAKEIYRKFIENAAIVKFDGQNIFIELLKKFHNPILFKTDYCTSPTKISW
ncbi:MAG: transposase, partial [Candidatus Hodarchaeota archaeon]